MGKKKSPRLLGIGFTGRDGHIRITNVPGYQLQGGSEETHQLMQEITARTAETLKKRGSSVETADHDRLAKTMAEVVERVEGDR